MRNDKQIVKEIKAWGVANPEIRAIILTSSRANAEASPDLFSDYDVEVTVQNKERFLRNEEWLSAFGEILTSFREDKEDFSMRLVLYADYVRIDFKIYEIDYLERSVGQTALPEHWDTGYRFLLDKDGISAGFISPSHSAFIIKQPVSDEFSTVVNDFWWDITYVAKSLWRDEVYYAKFMLDNIIRFSYLQKMIEWDVGLRYKWEVTTNKHGRFFKKYLDTDTWERLQKTFAGNSIEDNWTALFETTALFRQLATTVASALNYVYPQGTDTKIPAYLEKIKALDKDAADIR